MFKYFPQINILFKDVIRKMNNKLILTLVIVVMILLLYIFKINIVKHVSVYTISRLTKNIKQIPLRLIESHILDAVKPYIKPTLNKYKII